MYASRRGVALADLEVSLFGPPRIALDGVPMPIERHKTLALLAYLVVTRQPHGRDALAALLWPDLGPGHGRAVLRNALLDLSHAIGKERLTLTGDWVALREGPGLHVDVTHFCLLLADVHAHHHPLGRSCDGCLAALAEAVALYGADFLDGFTLRDTVDFDAWQTYQTERLRLALCGGLERLAWGMAEHGDYPSAIGHARRWSWLEPGSEAACRCLMQLHAAVGDRAAAAYQYQACAKILAEGLGVTPDAETTAVYEAIMRGKAAEPRGREIPSTGAGSAA
jgi:DNA-binding SARP family transcriptional activator